MSSFRYNALPQGRWTRLLQLLPGTSTDDLKVELYAVDLKTAPVYEAISYCWEDVNKRRTIACDGHHFDITVSLFKALCRFRMEASPRVLWADAICINQSDLSERANQVNLMGQIFHGAARVLIWAGEDDQNDVERTFEFIRRLNRHFEGQYLASRDGASDALPRISPTRRVTEACSLPDDGSLRDRTRWERYGQLLKRSWFSRVWVLQEVGLARAAIAFVGAAQIQFSEIAQLCFVQGFITDLMAFQKGVGSAPIGNACSELWFDFDSAANWLEERPVLQDTKAFYAATVSTNFVSILEVSTKFQATDPRDHIYAFLAHPHAKFPPDIDPFVSADYTIDVEELQRKFTARYCLKTQSLEILCSIRNLGPDVDLTNAIATWVPRWHRDFSGLRIRAAGVWDASLRNETITKFRVERQDSRLIVSGTICDTIDMVSQCVKDVDLDLRPDGSRSNSIDMVESCWKLFEAVRSIYNDKLAALARVLIGGRYKSKVEVDSDFEAYCRTYCSSECCKSMGFAPMAEGKNTETITLKAEIFLHTMQRVCRGRRVFLTQQGYIGVGPGGIHAGDVCAILIGSEVPIILRHRTGHRCFALVGESYINGVMRGEYIRGRQERNATWSDITLE